METERDISPLNTLPDNIVQTVISPNVSDQKICSNMP